MFRKFILKKYINKTLTEQNIKAQGYDKETIINTINSQKTTIKFNLLSDIIHYSLYKLIIRFNLYNFISMMINHILV